MASVQPRGFTGSLIILFIISSSSSSGHTHAIPRVTFPLESPGRPFTLFTLPDVYNTTTLLLSDDEEMLYVGARDAVLSLNISDAVSLQLSIKIDWSPTETDLRDCLLKVSSETDCPNFVRVLQVLNSTHMFACGTFAFSPRCSYISSEQFFLAARPEEGRGRCPYNPYHKNTAITVGGELYTATVADFKGNRPVISRHLSEGDRVDMKLDDTAGWLEEPTFISSAHIPSEGKVYFFFSELGREYDFIDKFTVSRVAQVCTSDVGGQRTLQRRWTTFTKAQLLCQARGELPYNVLQDITTLRPPEGASADDTLFYGIFSSQWSVNSGRSAVCVFSLRDVKAVFAGNYKVLNRDTLKWSTRMQEKIANPGECGLHNASDNVLRFVKENFLADKSVSPANQELTLVSPDRRYSNIAAQRVKGAHGKEYTVLYLLTESGYLHKTVLLEGGAHIIEEIQVLRQPQRVRNLLLSVSKGALFVGSSEGVASVPVSNCSHYWSCAECVLARDPFCAWDSTRRVCARVSSVTNQPVQDVDGGNVLKVCTSTVLVPRGRTIIPSTPTSVPVSVLLQEVVHLRCMPSSQLAELHWVRPGSELSPSIYIQGDRGNLSFLATPTTLGTYECQAVENGFTQTLVVYEVRQTDNPALPPSSTSPGAETGREATTRPTIVATPDAEPTAAMTQKPSPSSTVNTLVPSSSHTPADGLTNMQRETRPSYLKELVAVSVLLAVSVCACLSMAAYIWRKSYRSRTAPHLPSSRRDTGATEGGTDQETEALRGSSPQLAKHNGQTSPNTPSNGVSNGSSGHLPNIPI
ncbi:semaphorin-4A isoform X1 [Ictalurus punctatus]|uniref:Semaphorin-4A isoform X1 n=2 Tax=Ictalurus punctatus TaxID=7998 RepID=A0A9F7TK12_ICTPU|nr:semaphorin-4A isoform X1 [Ictalurus punctatus]XP_053540045.1 semaphorin-4A isoform X1 [Ictalurus punctatus]XP_053540046.1 semaphorin-4A isoform X1 [Ictalurus punctatus]XP_053540047.1 semaphorin-4A isoform X1 [Ictalurus punctatus]XP_053540048.1 semaphorin-4A isoform X1 [Ictalurus punctatus]